jgi:peptidoglycan biosynthesis protein MviN/MurJ (putative lipid II flippase)
LGLAIAVGVVLQAAFIALGTFALSKDADDGKAIDKDHFDNIGLTLHGIFAIVVAVLAIALLAISFSSGVPEGPKWAGYVFLAVLVQWVLAAISFAVPAVGLLHGINAFVVAALASMAARKATVGAPVGRSSVA